MRSVAPWCDALIRAILGFLRRRARDAGVADGRGGAVTIVQRFGGALNTNIHFNALVLDGVFAQEGDTLCFHRGPALDAADIDEGHTASVSAQAVPPRVPGRAARQTGSGSGCRPSRFPPRPRSYWMPSAARFIAAPYVAAYHRSHAWSVNLRLNLPACPNRPTGARLRRARRDSRPCAPPAPPPASS